MIDLYYWPTPNGHKITLFLEEAELPYQLIPVNISKGEQFKKDFLQISPNNRMPVIVDRAPKGGGEPISIFESGAILNYLAAKTGKFLPQDERLKQKVMQWLFWQVGGLGPMAGQTHHFTQYAPEKVPYAIDRYVKETNRLYGVLNNQLALGSYVAGEYSIADMAIYPWIIPYEKQHQDLNEFPNVKRWMAEMAQRPGTVRAYAKAKDFETSPVITDEARKVLFGQTAKTLNNQQ